MFPKEKAIIIGGGISGKLAARVLSDFFHEVIILERDQEPAGPFPRKGAPQGEHIHALLHAGESGLERLFPGITEKFYSGGAIKINSTKDLAWFHHGVWKLRYDGEYSTILQTRPHLEWNVEKYIKKIPNVTVHYNQVVKNYVYKEKDNIIVGVEVADQSDNIKTLTADLIVDASGVSGITSKWFEKRGIHLPVKKAKIGLSYISKSFQLATNEARDWAIKIVYPNPPIEKMGGTISKVEGNRYIVTINGYHNEINEKDALADDSGFLELAKILPKLDIYQEIKDATPLTSTSVYRVPGINWNQFQQVKHFPDRLIVIGDTICRIDPVFGQGMSIAVLEALALQKLLQSYSDSIRKVITKFHKHAAKIISPIWNMVINEDFRYPETMGKKPIGLFIQQWYARNIFLLSSQNQYIYSSLFKVMNLIQPMIILMQPRILKTVLKRTFIK
ncbi:2-polyprenyl-6-methoxyphenol hydroxylase-like FAD-dependent oxidoreductase [Bacillus sp. SORGH_AS 510]|uniref:NAD(P)/FAD-dependent oxidoreductase n=1 Tax=Bacillus sp. SORGH_AS_0510 TaxID=3041771 RepID=UPI00278AC154|nr:glutamate synthase subunit beta [Bacillus sp. SORGH_AS_0510]MDQ1145728.1 2-polyprenyl-6-methoxyphenol hydroxylase-like FAD-dependent oxidoreductase [Bacillus sp. SORGH_AS_0510]